MEFKDLEPKKKAEHIWEYYKWHILGAIFLVFVACSLCYNWFINPAPKTYCSVAVYGPHISIENTSSLNDYLTQKAVPAELNEVVEVVNFFFTEGKSNEDVLQDQNMLNKFYTYLYALELDIFIGTEEDFDNCVKAEFLAPITDYLPQEKALELEKMGIVFYDTINDTSESLPYGVSLENSTILKQLNILQDDIYYIGFVPIEGKEEKMIKTALSLIE